MMRLLASRLTKIRCVQLLDRRILVRFPDRVVFVSVIEDLGAQTADIDAVAYVARLLRLAAAVDTSTRTAQAFATGCRRIEALLKDRLVLVQHMETIKEKTGYEAFYCIDANPEFIKTLMVTLEDQDRLGRLFDIDVIRPDGSKVSREELGRPSRTCLLCKEPAHACSRSRRHSVAELTAEIGHILKDLY